MRHLYYAGVGCRKTPSYILEEMTKIAKKLYELGYILRSGASVGADSAFEAGVGHEAKKEIFIPWPNFTTNWKDYILVKDQDILKKAKQIASQLHPAWDKCSPGAKELHGRNVFQVLGRDLNTPVKVVLCYAKEVNGEVKGGTATAVNLAKQHNIPVYNFYHRDQLTTVLKRLHINHGE